MMQWAVALTLPTVYTTIIIIIRIDEAMSCSANTTYSLHHYYY